MNSCLFASAHFRKPVNATTAQTFALLPGVVRYRAYGERFVPKLTNGRRFIIPFEAAKRELEVLSIETPTNQFEEIEHSKNLDAWELEWAELNKMLEVIFSALMFRSKNKSRTMSPECEAKIQPLAEMYAKGLVLRTIGVNDPKFRLLFGQLSSDFRTAEVESKLKRQRKGQENASINKYPEEKARALYLAEKYQRDGIPVRLWSGMIRNLVTNPDSGKKLDAKTVNGWIRHLKV